MSRIEYIDLNGTTYDIGKIIASGTEITIYTATWTANTDTTTANAGFAYRAAVTVPGVTADHTAIVSIWPAYLSVASDAGVAAVNETTTDTVVFYAARLPSDRICATVQLIENVE